MQGQGSKNFDKAKELCFTNPVTAHQLLQKITDTTIAYLKAKVKAGVNAVQIFDSWGGMLSPTDYQEFSWQYINQIIEALKDHTPVIAFGKGCWFALHEMGKSGASALGVDWTCTARNARYLSGGRITLQGNFDPSRLLSPPSEIKKMVHQMINEFGKDRYIVNLIVENLIVEKLIVESLIAEKLTEKISNHKILVFVLSYDTLGHFLLKHSSQIIIFIYL